MGVYYYRYDAIGGDNQCGFQDRRGDPAAREAAVSGSHGQGVRRGIHLQPGGKYFHRVGERGSVHQGQGMKRQFKQAKGREMICT